MLEIIVFFFCFFYFLGNLLAYFGPPWAPLGPQNGPSDPGDRFKINKKKIFQKFGLEVSTIFENLIFDFLFVFQANLIFFDFSFFHPWGGPGPPNRYFQSLVAPWGPKIILAGAPKNELFNIFCCSLIFIVLYLFL